MRAVLLVGLALLSGPALAEPPIPPSAWLERQQTAAADEADAAGATLSTPPKAREQCRVVKEGNVGDTVVEHRVCDGGEAAPPAPPSTHG